LLNNFKSYQMKFRFLIIYIIVFCSFFEGFSQTRNQKIQNLNTEIRLNDSIFVLRSHLLDTVKNNKGNVEFRINSSKDSIQRMVINKGVLKLKINEMMNLVEKKKKEKIYVIEELDKIMNDLDSLGSIIKDYKSKIYQLNKNLVSVESIK
jgi:chromosome segregation ATPase